MGIALSSFACILILNVSHSSRREWSRWRQRLRMNSTIVPFLDISEASLHSHHSLWLTNPPSSVTVTDFSDEWTRKGSNGWVTRDKRIKVPVTEDSVLIVLYMVFSGNHPHPFLLLFSLFIWSSSGVYLCVWYLYKLVDEEFIRSVPEERMKELWYQGKVSALPHKNTKIWQVLLLD